MKSYLITSMAALLPLAALSSNPNFSLPTDSIVEATIEKITQATDSSRALAPIPYSLRPIAVNAIEAESARPLNLPKMEYATLADTTDLGVDEFFRRYQAHRKKNAPISIYALPYSVRGNSYDWHRLWINTAVLSGAFVGTLLVLETLPQDATTWNRAELQKVPLFKRWKDHVFVKGPEWDHDKVIFNYVLHPYAGAAYFMAARSCGFNFYRSLLYSTVISTICWEFGIEAFMERPSYQDIFITPLAGAIIGEGFYKLKRLIVNNGYEIAGSRFLGGLVCFLIDPVNEFVGLFAGNPARKVASELRVTPTIASGYKALTISLTF